jgi:signal transduction histidine kinase
LACWLAPGFALAGSWRPFIDAVASADGERPGYGVSLSRARLLVERHGGQLHVRSGDEGGVQITVPRRVNRGPIGIA